jgi:hypothetical protein
VIYMGDNAEIAYVCCVHRLRICGEFTELTERGKIEPWRRKKRK